MENKTNLFKTLPKVDECLAILAREPSIQAPTKVIKTAVQTEIENHRQNIAQGKHEDKTRSLDEWKNIFVKAIEQAMMPKFRRVINGTGVVIHTNLGRSILSAKTADFLRQSGVSYSNLEYDLETGVRGSRYSHVEKILCELSGAEAALVVNNNAAAVLIALDTLTRDKEVIVSRGQLVEIGGSFRIPDVMAKSGAKLIEVGATNRTHLYDYERAISQDTAMLLRVHTSNFRMIGFTSQVSAEELVALARKNSLLTMEDLGSGSLVDFSRYGFPKEPTVQEIVKAGVDVVTFSGDKLLGGPQAGIIVGRQDIINKIKRNPLNRALRIDKFTLATLESTLREYLDTEEVVKNIPTLAMLTVSPDELKKRAKNLCRRLSGKIQGRCQVSVIDTISRAGGGSLPEVTIASWAVALEPVSLSVSAFERAMRRLATPIIGRVEENRFLLDVRTIQLCEYGEVVSQLEKFFIDGVSSD